MAESAVASVLGQLGKVTALGKVVVPEALFLLGVRHDAELLMVELGNMQIYVRGADARRRRSSSEGFTNWVVDVRAAAYDSEDVLEEANLLALRRDLQRGCWSCLCSVPLAWCGDLVALHMLGVKIRRLRTRITEIHQGADNYGFKNLGEPSSIIPVCPQDVTPHDLGWVAGDGDYTWVVGFHKERDEIIRELIDTTALEICVVSIVGMGGSGKSTLARNIYHFLQGQKHFEAFCWLTVSQQYTFRDLIKDAARRIMNIKRYKVEEERKRHREGTSRDGERELTVETLEKMDVEKVKDLLRKELTRRRFLIVLDDVWSEINKIISVFPDVNNGSRIILTTRDLDVAEHVNKIKMNNIHQMQLLDQEQSWELLQKKAFQRHQISSFSDSDRSWLTQIGKKLAMKCHGLPLALVVLGGYLSRNLDYDIWLGLVDDLDWEARKDHEPIWDILSRSYNGLREHQLKSCFLYLASFPEDHIIRVKRLIKLLIAEGFVPESHNHTMEDTARQYINELAQRSMLQIDDWSKVDGSIKSVVLHDILRDWAIKEANREGFFNIWYHTTTVPVRYSDSMPAYRLALHNYSGRSQIVALMPKIRTLCLYGSFSKDLGLCSLSFLRVLDLYGIEDLQRLPSCIGKMMHLRYLGLQDCGKGRSIDIPPSVVDLLNLQTIDARNSRLGSLPRYFWDLTTFRHIHLEDVYSWAAPEIGRLLSVQTFHFSGLCRLWDVGRALDSKERRIIRSNNKCAREKNYREWTAMIEALSEMKQLVFLHLENWHSVEGLAKPAMFPRKLITVLSRHNCLSVLELHGRFDESIPIDHFAMLPSNLKKLKLTGSELFHDPMPVLGKLPNLVVLSLEHRSYEGEKMTCKANRFPSLQYLTFEGVYNVRHWDIEIGAFPSLIQLTLIFSFDQMTVPPRGLLHVESLQELHLLCLTSADVSLQNIETLSGMGCKSMIELVTALSDHNCLRVLELHGGLSSPISHFAMLPSNLKKLKLVGSKLLQDPMPVLGKLPNLVVLTLEDRSYEGEKMTCQANGFPRLKYLTFEEVSNVRHWDIEVGAFPALIQLKLIFSFYGMAVPPRGLLHRLQHVSLYRTSRH